MAHASSVVWGITAAAIAAFAHPVSAQEAATEPESGPWFGVAATAVKLHSERHDAGGLSLTGILGLPLSARWALQLELSRVWPSSHTQEFANVYYTARTDSAPPMPIHAAGRLTRHTHVDVAALLRFQPQPAAPVEFAFLLGMAWRVEGRHVVSTLPTRPAPGQVELLTTEQNTLKNQPFYAIGAELGLPVGSGFALVLAARFEGQLPRDHPEAITRAGVALRWRFR